MCSSLRPRSLRAKLTVAQVALLAVVCVIIVGVTGLALRAFLVGQLDSQLRQASKRADSFRDDPGRQESAPGGGRRQNPLDAPGFGPGTFVGMIKDGSVVDARRLAPGEDGGEQSLLASQRPLLLDLPVDSRPHTMALGDFGDYRIIAAPSRDGPILLTGLPLTGVYDTLWRLSVILGGVAVIGLLVAGVAGAFIVRRTLRPLDRVATVAGQVVALPLHRGEVALAPRVPDVDSDPATEVGRVGLALNRMLGHVEDALAARQQSETRVRQFVADASHELRTPLAAIRGYAELARRTPDEVAPEIAHALRRVESEAERMTGLVEDLLLLARLDAGRPLERAEVDLSRLVLDTVSDARIAGGEHGWQLELPAEPVTVTGDQARLHQVLANLLSNARTHTPPGTTVTTGIAVTPAGTVALTVADNGPGIPAELLPTVFERFARGDSSRSRGAGSTGLGLSIVAAVVAAHHGTVTVTSEPGRTAFVVELPSLGTQLAHS